MSKYIDADKLIDGIKHIQGKFPVITYDALLHLVTSLQQEQPEVDLEEEITSFFSENPIPYEHITDWPLLKNTAIHFYELGRLSQTK